MQDEKKYVFVGLAVVDIAVAGIFLWENPNDPAHPAASGPASQALTVSVLDMAKKDTRIQYELPGRITPYRQSQVRPQVNGVITKRLFEEGGRVKAGPQLYQIDDVRYRATYRSALADLKSAQSSLATVQTKEARYRDLLKTGAISEQGYDNVKAELEQAQAAIAVAQSAVDLAKVNLDYTKVYAPISGRIGRSFVSEGALVDWSALHAVSPVAPSRRSRPPHRSTRQDSGRHAQLCIHAALPKYAVPCAMRWHQASWLRPHQPGEVCLLCASTLQANASNGQPNMATTRMAVVMAYCRALPTGAPWLSTFRRTAAMIRSRV